MRQFLIDLYKIQKIDLSIRDDERRQAALPKPLSSQEQQLVALKLQVQQLTAQRDGTVSEARALQVTIDVERDKVRKWESRLDDIRNQREFQALQRETEGQKRATRDAEAKLQELHLAQEELQKKLENLEVQLADDDAVCSSERGRIDKLVAGLAKQISHKRKTRDELVPQVPKSLFRKYDTIRAKRMGMGLSMVTQGCCVGCHMRLPPQLYNTLQRGDDILQCPSCFRIIFWDQMLVDAGLGPQQDVAAE